jgi:hypothetical protein
MKKLFLFACGTIFLPLLVLAHEGMWIPAVLGAVYDDMRGMGLKLSKEDLYAVNTSSLKDAVVLFGGGCTAEMVSDRGLLFTNHHCGFDQIQYHSSLQNDYLKNGFWAGNMKEELPCPGLTATFVVSMEDVTARMYEGTTADMRADELDRIRLSNRKKIEEESRKATGLDVAVRAFNYGNQYFLIVTRTYKDVRLAGAPPGCIGKFGGDTDNWVWPRHTGDFSVFRIYANERNEPAGYNTSNVPYQPAHHFPISLKGVVEGDFSMIYGFPGRTEHFLSSFAVDYLVQSANPMRIHLRETSLAIIGENMRASDKVRIQYAAKQSSIANAYKKWIGQSMGLKKFNAVGKKKEQEELFMQKVDEGGALINELKSIFDQNKNLMQARDAFVEYVIYGPEVFSYLQPFVNYINDFDQLVKDNKLAAKQQELLTHMRAFFKDYDPATEKALFQAMSPLYRSYVNDDFEASTLSVLEKGGWENAIQKIYNGNAFLDTTRCKQWLTRYKGSKKQKQHIQQDAAIKLTDELYRLFNERVTPAYKAMSTQLDVNMYRYVKALRENGLDPLYWNDANSTLRIGFGKVEGSAPHDGMIYTYYTTADGILDKAATGELDFELLPELKKKLERREYGSYAMNGDLRVCYSGSNHTTGGNSGSPALNAEGHLVGINFDRSWESTMSDVYYSPEICRNIMVDVRYVLWVIDEYAGADWLLSEMTIVR